MGAQVRRRSCRSGHRAAFVLALAPPSPSAGTPLETGAQPLLPELLQSGLLLGLSVGVVGLAVIAAHLLTALQ